MLQHYGCAVTQPQLLWDAGISISAGELSNLLTKGHDDFRTEKDELLATGIRCSHYLQTDDTGARHKGQNGYCTVIVNDLFTWFGTTGSKSRENFLTLLHRPLPVYALNRHGLDYLEKHDLSKKWLRPLEQYNEVHFLSESQIREHVKRRKISGGTRSDAGRQCCDTFASLKKTCRQHDLSFWDYLKDRLNGTGLFPRLADVVEYASCWLPCGQCRTF